MALDGRAVLILGPSGSGKSALALQLMALGCALVSDDQTRLRARDGGLFVSAPDRLRGMIEARGVGLLAAEALPAARLVLVADLGQDEVMRLPQMRSWTWSDVTLPCLHRFAGAHFPAAVLQYMKAGRIA